MYKYIYFSCCISGLRRSSDDPDDFQVADDKAAEVDSLTEEQKAYLRWYYRTEDRKYQCCCTTNTTGRCSVVYRKYNLLLISEIKACNLHLSTLHLR